MRTSSVRTACFAMLVAAESVVCGGFASESRADDFYYYTPTAYYVPATAAVIGPAYPVARTYIPSSYATVYAASTVWAAPTAYVATVYERGLFRRRRYLVERPLITGYAETAYLFPTLYSTPRYRATVYEYPTVWESSYSLASTPICDDQVRPASTASTATEENLEPVPSQPPGGKPKDEATISSEVGAPKPPVAKPPDAKVEDKKSAGDNTPETPPRPTPATRDQSTARPATAEQAKPKPIPAAAPKVQDPPAPIAPADDLKIEPAPLPDVPGEIRRDSLKPNFDANRALGAARRGVLMGAVETNAGAAREEVRVGVTSRDRLDLAHNGVTNAFGRFAIRLEDGDWTVDVTLPSGRRYAVRRITVKDGRVVDRDENRDIPNLIITY